MKSDSGVKSGGYRDYVFSNTCNERVQWTGAENYRSPWHRSLKPGEQIEVKCFTPPGKPACQIVTTLEVCSGVPSQNKPAGMSNPPSGGAAPSNTSVQDDQSREARFCFTLKYADEQIKCQTDCKRDARACEQWKGQLQQPTATPSEGASGLSQRTPSGLQIIDSQVGAGPSPKPGQISVIHYTGWLYTNGGKGRKFDSSRDRGQTFEVKIGTHQAIAGWEEGISSMQVGGRRTLIVPPELGYGVRGAGSIIPPNSSLLFEIELLGVK